VSYLFVCDTYVSGYRTLWAIRLYHLRRLPFVCDFYIDELFACTHIDELFACTHIDELFVCNTYVSGYRTLHVIRFGHVRFLAYSFVKF
jgi:hypothetical protein